MWVCTLALCGWNKTKEGGKPEIAVQGMQKGERTRGRGKKHRANGGKPCSELS